MHSNPAFDHWMGVKLDRVPMSPIGSQLLVCKRSPPHSEVRETSGLEKSSCTHSWMKEATKAQRLTAGAVEAAGRVCEVALLPC